ncbi:MAG: MoxR family ATPase [Lachnospiraceae bacterium]|nr:MoxR family ATPase [Lachnospiraceae bacterium]
MNINVQKILDETDKVISGKRDITEKIVMSIIADGHILLDDVPGVGKTTLAIALGRILGMKYNRIQFTPDTLPSDIVGFSIYNRDNNKFEYRPGAVNNTNILLGDEINRTSSRTQSALLEAMEEKQVTVDGETHKLESPFVVIATQNTVGTVGTQVLPYAQMDRFLVALSIGYPDYEAQMEMMRNRQNRNPLDEVKQVVSLAELIAMQNEAAAVVSKDSILDYITRLAFATRENSLLELGISPRGAIFLDRMSKARAYCDGRNYVIPKDVRESFIDVCAHRVVLSEAAKSAGRDAKEVLLSILKEVKEPDSRSI